MKKPIADVQFVSSHDVGFRPRDVDLVFVVVAFAFFFAAFDLIDYNFNGFSSRVSKQWRLLFIILEATVGPAIGRASDK